MKRINLPLLVGGLGVTFLMLLMLAQGFGRDPHAVPSVLKNTPAPAFSLLDTQGRTVSLEQLKGQSVVLNFWSTWCMPCKQEYPLLMAAQKRYPDVAFLGVVYVDSPANITHYLQRAGVNYPHLLDPEGHTAIDYGVAGVPETFFIDASGTIMQKVAGPVNQPLLMALLNQLESPA
jgi:cytochrome c biogenesis protein CcmG/thiol:disulfide interchange protein DsbE